MQNSKILCLEIVLKRMSCIVSIFIGTFQLCYRYLDGKMYDLNSNTINRNNK